MYVNIFAYACYYQWISLQCKVQTQTMLLRMGMHIKYMNKSNQIKTLFPLKWNSGHKKHYYEIQPIESYMTLINR